MGHHGSATSSSDAFLREVGAEWAVVSVGPENRYGHPDPGILERLTRHGARVHRTDRGGALLLRPGPGGEWIVETHPPTACRPGSLSVKNTIW